MTPRSLGRLIGAVILGLAIWLGGRFGNGAAPAPPQASVPSAAPAPAAPVSSSVGFRDARHLADHFQKHGAEFGRITEAEYLRRAQALRDGPAGGEVLEARRADGVVTRYNRGDGAFLAFDPDGVIRTYFRPNDGEAYFRRQLQRSPGTP